MSPEQTVSNISEANRANAQLSTGPSTPEGKQRSKLNAGRHGLTGQVACMPWEDRNEFNRFCEGIVADYRAEGPIEIQLAQSIAEDFWRLNRGRAWENNMLALGYFDGTADRIDADHPQIADAFTQARVFEKQGKNFSLISLYETRINRNVAKNEQRLAARQAERRAAFAQAVEETKLLMPAETANVQFGPAAITAAEANPPHAHSRPGLIPTKTQPHDRSGLIPSKSAATSTVLVGGFVFSTAQIHAAIAHQRRLELARLTLPRALKAA